MGSKRASIAFFVGLLSILVGAQPTLAAIDTSSSPLDLAFAMTPDNSVIAGAAFVATPGQPSSAVSDTSLTVFPTSGTGYAILSTGDASLADDPNAAGDSGVDLGGGNLRGDTDFDVSVLQVDLDVPAGVNCLLGLDFQFLSEEFPEFVGTQYNDAFIAELDASTWTTSGSDIIAPNNFAFDPVGNPISINAAGSTSMSEADASGTTYDGATPALRAATPISPGPHSLFLSIFDQGDGIYDSAVFLDNLRLGTVSNVATECVPGAQPVARQFEVEVRSFIPQDHVANPSPNGICFAGLKPRKTFFEGDDRSLEANVDLGDYRTQQRVVLVPEEDADPNGVLDGSYAEDVGLTRRYASNALADGEITSADNDGILHDCNLLDDQAFADVEDSFTSDFDRPFDTPDAVDLHWIGDAQNPLATFAGQGCAIDYDLRLRIDQSGDGSAAYAFVIEHDGFPAFEVYVNNEVIYSYEPEGASAIQAGLGLCARGPFGNRVSAEGSGDL